MNFAITAAASQLSTAALSSALNQAPAAGGSGAASAFCDVDDIPLCGTKVPGQPPRPPLGGGFEQVALNPQPLPPAESGGRSMQGGVMSWEDGDWCGTVPHRFPFPPPPPQWNDLQSQLGVQAL